MPLAREKKQEVMESFALAEGDTGSPEVQIALLTERIREKDAARYRAVIGRLGLRR